MSLNIEPLDLENFDINTIDNQDTQDNTIEEIEDIEKLDDIENIDFVDFEDCNIIYSYPYYSDDTHDYEYRITIDKTNVILDEVKCNDDEADFDNCIILIKNIFKEPIELFKETLLNKNKNINIDEDSIIDLNCNSDSITEDEKQSIINKNKNIVLSELYKEVSTALFN